jgi:hypothetical protein
MLPVEKIEPKKLHLLVKASENLPQDLVNSYSGKIEEVMDDFYGPGY